jgi:hypothetical protein
MRSDVLRATVCVKCLVLWVSSQSGLLATAESSTGTSAACRIKCLLESIRSSCGRGTISGLVKLRSRRYSSISRSPSSDGRRAARSSRFSSTSSRTATASTSLQTLAAHSDRVALSRPHGAMIPPVMTFESKNSRILRGWVTSCGGEDECARLHLRTSCRNDERKADRGPREEWQEDLPALHQRWSGSS